MTDLDGWIAEQFRVGTSATMTLPPQLWPRVRFFTRITTAFDRLAPGESLRIVWHPPSHWCGGWRGVRVRWLSRRIQRRLRDGNHRLELRWAGAAAHPDESTLSLRRG